MLSTISFHRSLSDSKISLFLREQLSFFRLKDFAVSSWTTLFFFRLKDFAVSSWTTLFFFRLKDFVVSSWTTLFFFDSKISLFLREQLSFFRLKDFAVSSWTTLFFFDSKISLFLCEQLSFFSTQRLRCFFVNNSLFFVQGENLAGCTRTFSVSRAHPLHEHKPRDLVQRYHDRHCKWVQCYVYEKGGKSMHWAAVFVKISTIPEDDNFWVL